MSPVQPARIDYVPAFPAIQFTQRALLHPPREGRHEPQRVAGEGLPASPLHPVVGQGRRHRTPEPVSGGRLTWASTVGLRGGLGSDRQPDDAPLGGTKAPSRDGIASMREVPGAM
jgi:hypothetical protein